MKELHVDMNLPHIKEDLLRLSKTIGEAKTNVSKISGKIEEIERQVKEEFGLSSPKEIEKKLLSLKKTLGEKKEKVMKEYTRLKEEFEW